MIITKKNIIETVILIILVLILLLSHITIYKYHNPLLYGQYSENVKDNIKKNDIEVIEKHKYIILEAEDSPNIYFIGTPASRKKLSDSQITVEKVGWIYYYTKSIRYQIASEITTAF